ncbi:MAG: hypothetical protein FWD79_06170 [Desulfobulbus sp.]|nr:hypothetical protein [Desulfobulbus sp.]
MMHSPIWTRVRAAVVVLGWLALLTPSILCGCAPQRQWARNGVTQTAFDQDAARCRRKAAKATYREPFAYASGQEQGLEQSVAQEKIFEQCMFAQGYRLEEKPSSR